MLKYIILKMDIFYKKSNRISYGSNTGLMDSDNTSIVIVHIIHSLGPSIVQIGLMGWSTAHQ